MLLRLKQASNPAFAFLSDEDPVHPYYLFLKTWGESALAAEYARQQQLKVERADVKKREAEREQERAEAAKGPSQGHSGSSGSFFLTLLSHPLPSRFANLFSVVCPDRHVYKV